MHPRHRTHLLPRPLVLPLLAVLLVAATPAPGMGAAAVGWHDAAAFASGIWPNVAEVDGLTLAELEIVDEADRPVDDVVVVAALWPNAEARAALEPGETFSLTPIDRIPVRDGRVIAHVDDRDLLRAHTSKDGSVLVHFDVFTAEGMTVLRSERRQDRSGAWVESQAAAASNGVRRSRHGLRTFRLDRNRIVPLEAPVGVEAPVVTRDHNHPSGCSAVKALSDVAVPETVATLAVTKGVKANLTYTTTAETTSSLGAYLGAAFGWEIDGSSTKKSTIEGEFVTVTGSSTSWTNKEYRVTWAHHRYNRHCSWNPWQNQLFTVPYKAIGAPPIIDSRYPLPGCVHKADLSGFSTVSTTSHTAMTYQEGFKITWEGSTFKGNSRSGYTSQVKIKFTRPIGATYWYWCGDAFAPQDSYKVRAGR